MKDDKFVEASVIVKDFEINTDKSSFSDEELLLVLSEQIEYMLEHRAEHLFSLLYRMDVKEAKANAAMHPLAPESANVGLARLVLERQKERNETRLKYKQAPIENLEDGLEY